MVAGLRDDASEHKRTFSENTLNIGLGEIVPDVEQPATMLLRHLIGEAVAEVQSCRMRALAPPLIRSRDTPGRSRRHTRDLKSEPVDQANHFFADIAPRSKR